MKKIILLLGIIGSFAGISQSTIRVVNGQNLQSIIDGAANNSVIIVEGGSYGTITINKPVLLYGTGYFLDNNSIPSGGIAILSDVNFKGASSGSILSGFQLNNINLGANSLVVARNKANIVRIGYDGTNLLQADNCQVKQNFADHFEAYNNSTNYIVKNNIFNGGFYILNSGYGMIEFNCFSVNNSGTYYKIQGSPNLFFRNNLVNIKFYTGGYASYGNYSGGQAPFTRNNFIRVDYENNASGYVGSTIGAEIPLDFTYNVINQDWLEIHSSNIKNVDFSNIYLGYPNNPNNLQEDARYQLAPNSPTKGAGEGGTDCGAFGGDEPYVLSGIPSIPSIYQLTVPSQVQQGGMLNVQIKAKVNN